MKALRAAAKQFLRLRREPLACAAVVLLTLSLLTWLALGTLDVRPSIDTLSAAGAASVAREDSASALIWYQRAMVDYPDDERGPVGFARTLDRLGRRAQALDVLATAAPAGTTRMPAAHRLASQLLFDDYTLGTTRDAASLDAAATHMRPFAGQGDADADELLRQIEALR